MINFGLQRVKRRCYLYAAAALLNTMFNFPHRIYICISNYPQYKENLFHDIFNGLVLVLKT